MSEDFAVKSRFHDYSVEFSEDLARDLSDLLEEGDVILVDEAIRQAHGERIGALFSEWPTVEIKASEEAKSFEKIGDTIETLISSGYRRRGRLLVVGGGASIPGLKEHAASALGMGVQVVAPRDVADCAPAVVEECGQPVLMMSIGLASFFEE